MANRLNQYSTRAILDGSLTVTANFANQGANAATNAIDLGTDTPWPAVEIVDVLISTTNGVANNGNGGNINIVVQDSNVNLAANFTNVAGCPVVLVSANAAVFNVNTAILSFPNNIRQYVRLLATTDAGAGNANTGTMTMKLAF